MSQDQPPGSTGADIPEFEKISLKGCGLAAISFAILIALILSGIIVVILYFVFGDDTCTEIARENLPGPFKAIAQALFFCWFQN